MPVLSHVHHLCNAEHCQVYIRTLMCDIHMPARSVPCPHRLLHVSLAEGG
jgi:hypothetical protein